MIVSKNDWIKILFVESHKSSIDSCGGSSGGY